MWLALLRARRTEPALFGARKSEGTAGAELLAVGLGNPGPRYSKTRHNVGADVVALLAERRGDRLRQGKELALVAEVRVEGKRLALAFPQTFMNESGRSVARLVRRFNVSDLTKLVVVHDELDLPLGTVRVKAGGGLAGHNGLRSIKAWLRSDEFSRVRIGIGKPPGGKDGGAEDVYKRQAMTWEASYAAGRSFVGPSKLRAEGCSPFPSSKRPSEEASFLQWARYDLSLIHI